MTATVDAGGRHRARIVDTRKTRLGLRLAQKIRGRDRRRHQPPRRAFYDGILVKENHIIAAGGIREVIEKARAIAPPTCSSRSRWKTFRQMREALEAGGR